MTSSSSAAMRAIDSGGPLMDRGSELEAAEVALQAAVEGRRSLMAISGEAGMGKTRFARAIALRAGEYLEQCVWARGIAGTGKDSYVALADALDDARPGDTRRRPPSASPRALRERIDAAAHEASLALVFDDAQWADEPSLAVLADLVASSQAPPMLVVITCVRGLWPAELLRALRIADRHTLLADIALSPLTPAGIDALLSAQLEERTRRRIRRQSGGNPRFAVELDRAARRHGESVVRGLPSTLRAMIITDLESLSGDAHELLRSAAVLGDRFEPPLATAVARLDAARGGEALDELAARGFIAPVASGRFRFARPIVRRVVYQEMGVAARTAAHERAARELASAPGTLAARAHHVEHGAGWDPKAVSVLLEAAVSPALKRPASASRWLAAALRKMDDADGRRFGTLMHASVALLASGRFAEGREAYEEAWKAELAGGPRPASALVSAAHSERMLSVPSRTRPMLEAALARDDDGPSAAAMEIALASECWRLRELDAASRHALRAADWASRCGQRCRQAHAAGLRALVDGARGAIPAAVARALEAESVLSEVGDDELAADLEGLLLLGGISLDLELSTTADTAFRRAARVAGDVGNRYYLVSAQLGGAAVALALGDLEAAREAVTVASAAAESVGSGQLKVWTATLASAVALASGRATEAVLAGERAARAADQITSGSHRTNAQCALGIARIDAGGAQSGREHILRHAGGAGLPRLEAGRRPRVYAALAQAAIQLGDIGAARAWVESSESAADELGLSGRWAIARSARAELMLARDEAMLAIEPAEQAAKRFTDAGRTVDAGMALCLVGRARNGTGDRHGALTAFRRAHGLLAEARADRRADAAARELRDLGVVVPRSSAGRSGARMLTGLTQRELEVAELVAEGFTNRRIADELFLSPRTVEGHLARVFEKLGVTSRAAVAAAVEAAKTRAAGGRPDDRYRGSPGAQPLGLV